MSEARRYADVIVRQRNRAVGPLSYSVPAGLRGHVDPGQLVWVPFRQSRLPGIVVSLSDEKPNFAVKKLEAIIDPRPVLNEAQLALGDWVAHYYCCSLADALFAMLPPGLMHRVRTWAELTEEGRERPLADLGALSGKIIAALREVDGGTTMVALARSLGRRGLSRELRRLSDEGWLALRTVVEEPDARPHYEPFLVLTASEEEVALVRQKLWAGSFDSAPARVLETLARAIGGTRSLTSLRREFKVRRSTLRSLEEEGLVQVVQEERTLCLTAEEDELETFLRQFGSRAPVQAALIRELLEAGGRVDLGTVEASASVRKALRQRKLIREDRRPAQVRLAVSPEVAQGRAALQRRTKTDERQAVILDVLAQSEGRALALSEVYQQVDGAQRADVDDLIEAGVVKQEERHRWRDPLADRDFPPEKPPTLTERQGHVWREIFEAFGMAGRQVFLLHGVTGSGKTEIYLRALGRALRDGRQAIVLVPEISLTSQTVRRFAARFPGRIAIMHSRLTVGERYDQWRRVRDGLVDVVIGPRSALFAPLPRLGLIVVDEEYEDSYKQTDRAPRYHARDTALALARITGSVVVLGGATPSVETYYRALRGQIRLLELPERIRVRETTSGARQALADTSLPQVQIVDMRAELRAGNRSIFSRTLQKALREVLSAGEQAILFLNRRGTATFVMCRVCGHVVRCGRCEVPYVYHAERDRLVCHRCGREVPPPKACPECGSRRIRHFGAGTERVEREALRFLPKARVLRWDSDAIEGRHGHEQILDHFVEHKADILVGTQLVAKGLDLPLVTLVGVISADTALHLPDFRSAERTFQLVTQVVGRAGRREERGLAIVQTYHPDHYAVRAAAQQDYGTFFRQEMIFRRQHGYPPLLQLALLLYVDSKESRCREQTRRIAAVLEKRAHAVPNARLIGPAPAFVHKQRGRYRWQLLLLAPEVHPLLKGLDLSAKWSIDIDPVSLLA